MIDKDIEIVKEIQEELNKDVYMEKNNLIRKEKWREQAQAIENVLKELKIKDEEILSMAKGKLNLAKELETHKKIAEKLASLIHKSNTETGCYVGRYGLVENCKGMTWCKQCIIDWAKREVEK